MPTKNVELQRKYRLTWYYKNKEKQIAKQKERFEALREWLVQYKRTLFCSSCGMSFKEHPECCDFHHIGEKKLDIAHLLKWSKSTVLKELEKCIPICANCHRILHFYKENTGQ